MCMTLMEAKRPQGDTKFELLLDRLKRLDDASVPVDAVPPILMAVAHSMDKVGGAGSWGVRWAWESGEALFKKLIGRVEPNRRGKVSRGVFVSGKSIGWLMNVVRHEMWGHGWVGERSVVETERLLSGQELKRTIKVLLKRLNSMDRGVLVETPNLLNLMYGWKEADDEEGVLRWVREQATTDKGFLSLLSACRGWMHSDKVYHPLNRRELAEFVDFDEMLERLKGIVECADAMEDDRRLAIELLEAAKLGESR